MCVHYLSIKSKIFRNRQHNTLLFIINISVTLASEDNLAHSTLRIPIYSVTNLFPAMHIYLMLFLMTSGPKVNMHVVHLKNKSLDKELYVI